MLDSFCSMYRSVQNLGLQSWGQYQENAVGRYNMNLISVTIKLNDLSILHPQIYCNAQSVYIVTHKESWDFNPLNATGVNMHQILMLIDNYGIERIKQLHYTWS